MEIIISVLTDRGFLEAFIQTALLILLGFAVFKLGIIDERGESAIAAVVWKIAVPCLAFDAFMTNLDAELLRSEASVLMLGAVLFPLFFFLTKLLFIKKGGESSVFALLCTLGQLTLFSLPVLESIYEGTGSTVTVSVSMITIPFRIMLYIVAIIVIERRSGKAKDLPGLIRRCLLNPIMIAMLAGLAIWLTQNIMPQVATDGSSFGILRLDMTAPYIYKIVTTLKALAFPLCIMLIGISMAKSAELSVFKDHEVIAISAVRIFLVPLLTLGICILLQMLGVLHFGETELMAVVICFAAPSSATLVLACISNRVCDRLASRVYFMSTLFALLGIPVWYLSVKLAILLPCFS